MGYKLTSNRDDYLTPQHIINSILFFEGKNEFDIDVCCSIKNIPAKIHYTIKENGLDQPWAKLNWCNPPFKYCRLWIKKAMQEQFKGNSTWFIIPFRPECVYWDKILNQPANLNNRILENEHFRLQLLKKGLKFLDPDTNEPAGVFKNALALLKLKGFENENN